MSVTCGFYNSLNHDRKYNATQMSSLFDGIINDGVFMSIGTHLSVTAGSGMSVTVGEGKAWFNHTWTLNDAELPLTIEASELVLDRIDAVVLEVNATDSVRDNFIKVVKGTPSSEPVRPEMENTETVHQYALAYIYVKANATSITTSDITNMIGTGDTPFITGILETINIDSLIAQWKSQWNDQVDSNQREYDAWLLAQQTSFLTWREGETSAFDTWKTTEQAEFEEWFTNLQNQLDENQATNLQNQINEINEDIEELTDALPYAGGSRVIVTIDDKKGTVTVAGLTATLRIGSSVYTATVGNDNKALFAGISEIGTAEIECNDSTQGLNTGCTLDIPCYSFYEVSTVKIDMYEAWLATAGYTTSKYPELETILSDEEAMFRMMNLHASVDYWVRWYSADNTILPKFTASATAMKAIGDNDYAADTLMAIQEVEEALLDSEYWEYILNTKVPTMTSNTSPEGEASASGVQNSAAWNAFNNARNFHSNAGLPQWIQYKFVVPTCVKTVKLLTTGVGGPKTSIVQGSNDGSTWADIDSFVDCPSSNTWYEKAINNDNYYLYYRLRVTESNYKYTGGNDESTKGYYLRFSELQFYGRQLKDLVPKMTSNTEPSGEASADSVYNTSLLAYRAFDGDDNTSWASTVIEGAWVMYKFIRPTIATGLYLVPYSDNGCRVKNFKLQGSNDGANFVDVYVGLHDKNHSCTMATFVNDNEYLYYRLYVIDSYSTIRTNILTLQLYGPDYDETVEPATGVNFDYSEWCESAGLNAGKYASLDDLLDDEKGIRTLMTKTASVDYLVQALTDDSASAAKILEDIYVAKWVNYREYAYASLSAVPGLKSIMDETGKYGMYITVQKSDAKPTEDDEVDKALVPKLTSNTGSNGEVSASGYYNYAGSGSRHPYYAFDGDTSTIWINTYNSMTGYIQYKFNSPTKVNKFSINVGGDRYFTFTLQASNDGVDYTDLSTGINSFTNDETEQNIYVDVANENGYYLYYKLNCTSTSGHEPGIKELQFYGRQIDALVPKMTSDTAPSGEVIYSGKYTGNAYSAFDGVESTYWYAQSSTNPDECWIGYDFTNAVKVNAIAVQPRYSSDTMHLKDFKIQGSDDKQTWNTVYSGTYDTPKISNDGPQVLTAFSFENDASYRYWRMTITSTTNPSSTAGIIHTLQFYGKVKPQPKGLIPVMTSNTCEVGEAISSTTSSTTYDAYKAFDNDDTTCFSSKSGLTKTYIGYKFANPTEVRTAKHRCGSATETLIFQYSDDGSTWTDASDTFTSSGSTTDIYEMNEGVGYHIYWRLYWPSTPGTSYTLQFYGYQLIPMVPTLTSNNGSDGGGVIYDSVNSSDYAYQAFDDSTSTVWSSTLNTNGYIGYHFRDKVVAKAAYLYQAIQRGTNYRCNECKIQASHDGNDWNDLTETITIGSSLSGCITLDNTVGYEYYRLYITNAVGDNNRVGVASLQFYGVEKWQPKGLVPVMTSNTAPYGESKASSTYTASGHQPWNAFDGNTSNSGKCWITSDGSITNQWMQYRFVNPTVVKSFKITNRYTTENTTNNNAAIKNFELRASNDGVTFETLGTYLNTDTSAAGVTHYTVNNNSAFLYYRIYVLDGHSSTYLAIGELQFYGRQLEALVPPMTSNTMPYGKASMHTVLDGDAWKAFDGDVSTRTRSKDEPINEYYLQYESLHSFMSKFVKLSYKTMHDGSTTKPNYCVKLQGSNNGSEWTDISSNILLENISDSVITTFIEVNHLEHFKYFRVICVSASVSTALVYNACDIGIAELQFYGAPDYESRTYIYDHGVELMEVTSDGYTQPSNSAITMVPMSRGIESYKIRCEATTASVSMAGTSETVDFGNYKLLGCRYKLNVDSNNGQVAVDVDKDCGAMTALSDFSGKANGTYLVYLDITNVNSSGYAYARVFGKSASNVYAIQDVDVIEFWLE